jgi:hypothetical protein
MNKTESNPGRKWIDGNPDLTNPTQWTSRKPGDQVSHNQRLPGSWAHCQDPGATMQMAMSLMMSCSSKRSLRKRFED